MSQNHKEICLVLTTTLTLVLFVSGFRFTPFATYHLCMMNGFSSDTLSLQCHHESEAPPNDANGDPLLIPVHGSYNWSFHPIPERMRTYYCSAQYGVKGGRGGHLDFEAFADEMQFLDEDCGGRHCIWMYNESAVFLFNLDSQQYNLMYNWQPIP